ncbi:helicase [Phyllobacterium leguminum]|uniref:Superfamily II DNA or RNA helicase n=1 Tax=Phyllobacterium leguminum TaxID=314237 RepID=A0A318T881_9HYPH|nr:helicase [Phyllobacterium leguminum]PYE89618.1 superfamily II DNA or RNA helicase [Phyllobacterium leguminum]
MDGYQAFLERKRIIDPMTGLNSIPPLPGVMFPFQSDITSWTLRRGRAALFAGTGLGKTLMELSWGQAVASVTGGMVLLLAPLAVSAQVIREAKKFGISARLVKSQDECGSGINVTNYQKIDHFDMTRFVGVILDESSILKSTDGHYRTRIIELCRDIPYRLAATATPAPNDFMELGNHAEFLGVMSYTDMLSTFFTHDGGDTQKWRLKGHAENEFWKWMASWAVMLREPADLGYSNEGYDLPPLIQHQHTVEAEYSPSIDTGLLFPMQATTMQERLSARRGTVTERVALAASLTPANRPFVWWCHLNSESEALAKAIPEAVETKGSDTDDVKERKLLDFIEGRTRVLVTKPSVAGFGLNFQHCADCGFVGLNDSFEQIYQAVRRFWRFGQTKPVNVHFIAAETEGAVVANLRRKERDADRMASAMVRHMSDLSSAEIRGSTRTIPDYNPMQPLRLPEWIGAPA